MAMIKAQKSWLIDFASHTLVTSKNPTEIYPAKNIAPGLFIADESFDALVAEITKMARKKPFIAGADVYIPDNEPLSPAEISAAIRERLEVKR